MKNTLNKVLMVIGYLLLWMSVTGLYGFLLDNKNVGDILASLSVALPLSILSRWFSLVGKPKLERVLTILSDIFFMFMIRGIIGVTTHFLLPNEYMRYISEPLLYGTIFTLIGSIGSYFLSKINKKEVVK